MRSIPSCQGSCKISYRGGISSSSTICATTPEHRRCVGDAVAVRSSPPRIAVREEAMGLLVFLVKRLAMIAASLAVIIAISYTLMWFAPGNYLDIQRTTTGLAAKYGENSAEFRLQRKLFEERYGLDKPLPVQIWIYIKRAATFDFGPSFSQPGVQIQDLVLEALPRTLTLILLGICLALILGIPIGVVAALKRNSLIDYAVISVSMIGQVIPSYVLAIAMILILAGGVWNLLPD